MKNKADLLIEIGCEELPPKNLQKLLKAFEEGMKQHLSKAEIDFDPCQSFASPRRLAVLLSNVALTQADRKIQKRGPAKMAAYDKNGNPTQAALGFAKSCGIDISEVSIEETPKGAWLVYEQAETGKTIFQIIPSILKEVLANLPTPRPMRWGNSDFAFVRPVHWILALYGTEIIPLNLFNIESSHATLGHRFLRKKTDNTAKTQQSDPVLTTLEHKINIPAPKDYESILQESGFVIADFEKRKAKIKADIEKIATSIQPGAKAIIEEDLLNEVTGIVEWPVVLVGSFDPAFLTVPREALISAMQTHQKSFPIINAKGELLAKFIITSNIESIDPNAVILGNESVMRARLSDAAFYYRIDKDIPLHIRQNDLKNVTFQKGLGSLWDKTQRIAHLGKIIARVIGADPILVERAAHLCKSDLLTQMVGEFPELQGIMGRYYALHDAEPPLAAQAIEEHYLPRFAQDELPSSNEGAVLSIADRIDTVVGLFILDKKPTGDKDPFGLRRQALGMLRIIIEKDYDLDLKSLLLETTRFYLSNLQVGLKDPAKKPDEEALAFCFDRLRAFYQEQKISPRVFEAVWAKQISNPNDFNKRILAVHAFQSLPEAESLAEANKRVQNLLSKALSTYSDLVLSKDTLCDVALLKETAESALAKAISEKNNELKPLLAEKNYTAALKSLAELKAPIDQFFNDCMVMVDDPIIRNNRLQLLNTLRNLFLEIADISLL
jgi:glycyl-tRNA synthetase beta chain